MIILVFLATAMGFDKAVCSKGYDHISAIEYQTYQELVAEEQQAAANEFRDPKIYDIPQYGLITVYTLGYSLGRAETDNYSVVITDKYDRPVQRIDSPDAGVPNTPPAPVPLGANMWWDLFFGGARKPITISPLGC